MGRKSGVVTVIDLLDAFVARKRWRQAELAREVGVTVPALRKHLGELKRLIPLEDIKEHPDVFWQVPRSFQAAGLVFRVADGVVLLRLLARLPRSTERDRLLDALLQRDPRLARPRRVQPPEYDIEEAKHLELVEDAAVKLVPLRMKYASRNGVDWRVVSVARVFPGPPARFFAVCHRSGELRTFRVTSMQSAHLAPEEQLREAAEIALERRTKKSVGGYFDGSEGEETFVVRGDARRWVRSNAPAGVTLEVLPDGSLRGTGATAGLPTLARFVVGLGGDAVCETPALAREVRCLAEGAMGRGKRLNGRPGATIQTRGLVGDGGAQ